MSADRRPPDEHLFSTRWVHVFEEDTGDGAVYRPEDASIPLSRRPREQLVLDADGQGTLFAGGADDRLGGRPITWRHENAREVTSGSKGDIRVVDRAADRLVVRMPES